MECKGCTTRATNLRPVAAVMKEDGLEKDPSRFYCPFPGCNRSFAELWRLKVHYRAAPDVRGSGKERGHGMELSHCPKCNEALKPGKHHIRCSASVKTASRKRSRATTSSVRPSKTLSVISSPTSSAPSKTASQVMAPSFSLADDPRYPAVMIDAELPPVHAVPVAPVIPVPAPQSVPSVGNYTWMDSEALPSAKRPRTATTRSGGSSATFQDEHLIAPPAHISHHETAPAPVHEDPLEALLSRDVGAAAAFTGASGSAAPPPTFREVVDGPAHPERKGVSAVPSEVDLKGMMMQMKRCPQPAELDMDDIEALFSASCHEGLPAPAQVPTFPMSRCPTREEMACLFEGFDFTDI